MVTSLQLFGLTNYPIVVSSAMNILCVCRGGNVRSVALKMILHRSCGHHAVACGTDSTSPELIELLCGWADKIVALRPEFLKVIPVGWRAKETVLDVGEDVWGNPFHPELHRKLAGLLMHRPDLVGGKQFDPSVFEERTKRYLSKIEKRREIGLAQESVSV